MFRNNALFSEQLGTHWSPREVLEMEKTCFNKIKYNRGRFHLNVWVFGGIKNGSKIFFVVALVEQESVVRDKQTVLCLIKKNIINGTTKITDCWSAYKSLVEYGYAHLRINQSEQFVYREILDMHSQKIKCLWMDFKEFGHTSSGNTLNDTYSLIPYVTVKNNYTNFSKKLGSSYVPQQGR